MVRGIFLPMLRLQPKINPFPPEVKTYDEYSAGLENFMSLTTSRIEELKGSMLLVMDPSFISILTNCYYGGKLASFPLKKAEFTATEERIIEIVSDGIGRALENAWKDLMPISIKNVGREINPQFATLVESTDSVIICSFVIQLPNVDSASFDVIYPLQTLKPIASLLRSRVNSDVVEDDKTWRERLQNSVLNVPLPVSAILSEPKVKVSQMVNFKKGDLLQLGPVEGVDFLVDKKILFKAEIGESNGQAAISLKNRIS
jgi:flagellar motor switch protein FliM